MNIDNIINFGLDFGADFVEIFREETRRSTIALRDSSLESASIGTDFGYGIRLIFKGEVLYVESCIDDEIKLMNLISNLCEAHQFQKGNNSKTVKTTNSLVPNIHPIEIDPKSSAQDKKLNYLRRADTAAREYHANIKQVSASVFDESSHVLIANSDGLSIEDSRTRSRMMINVTAMDGHEMQSGSESPGALQGHEFFEALDIEFLAKRAAERAQLMLGAGYIQGNKMPVIIGNGFGGVIFHEACGHPLETEKIRKKASPFTEALGKRIAQDCLTAIDDGTLPGVWGSLNIDDEGMPTQKTTLIENGILKNFLSDKVGAEQLNLPRTGSARRESFRYAPVSRMRNTFIAPGNDTLDSMVSSIEEGLYAKVMGGGSVNPATGEFNFSVQEGYIIRKGKVEEAVRGATLLGKGHEVLPLISKVGNDLGFAAGMCGASSGSVPVTVGQPTIKVDSILVGGR